jgi:hypothetical protein
MIWLAFHELTDAISLRLPCEGIVRQQRLFRDFAHDRERNKLSIVRHGAEEE